ncbi:hypothetical protein SUGI_0938480 [Cryptomeria japonica]|nr:hypothetical protein SUGI_0938480 [Cryptomeria japonica]
MSCKGRGYRAVQLAPSGSQIQLNRFYSGRQIPRSLLEAENLSEKLGMIYWPVINVACKLVQNCFITSLGPVGGEANLVATTSEKIT